METVMNATRFNQKTAITSELGSPEERQAKIEEMEARGFVVARTYEYSKQHTAVLRRNGTGAKIAHYDGDMKYGVLFRRK